MQMVLRACMQMNMHVCRWYYIVIVYVYIYIYIYEKCMYADGITCMHADEHACMQMVLRSFT